MKLGSIIVLLLFSSQQIYCFEQSDLRKTYTIEPSIEACLDEHADTVYRHLLTTHNNSGKHGVWQFSWLPGYYVKYGIARIVGLERMQAIIDEYHLDKVVVADKRLYHLKGQPYELSDLNYAVIVKAVTGVPSPPITEEEIRQLCTIMHKTGYISMTGPNTKKGPNYIRTEDGKFCLIDTESRYDHHQLLKGFLRMLESHDLNTDLSQDALKYVLGEIKELIRQQPHKLHATFQELKHLMRQQPPRTWNYKSYIKQLFTDLTS